MLRSPWLYNLFGLVRSDKDRHGQAAQLERRVRLTLEPLEDRITPSQLFNPHTAVSNALAAETATKTYLIAVINTYIHDLGPLASPSTQGNGSTPSISGQNGMGGALAALSQFLTAIGSNPVALMGLQLQQGAQNGTPAPTGTSVSIS